MKMKSFWKQQILFILVFTIVFTLLRYCWEMAEGENSSIAIFTRSFIGAAISSMIIYFMNRKKNKALNDHP